MVIKKFGIKFLFLMILVSAVILSFYAHVQNRKSLHRDQQAKAIRLIEDCPGLYLEADFDPTKVVKTVNYLRKLGFKRSIQTLEAFLKKYPYDQEYSSQHQKLALIVPLLFSPRDPESKIIAVDPQWEREVRFTASSRYEDWVRVEDGIPFSIVSGGGLSGIPPDQSPLVAWAKGNATLRSTDLVPASNPFAAAESLAKHLKSTGISDASLEWHLNQQAFAMVMNYPDVVEKLLPNSNSSQEHSLEFNQKTCQTLRKNFSKSGIVWDRGNQRYVLE